MFMFKRNKELLNKLEKYLETAEKTIEVFFEAMEYIIEHGLDEHFLVLAQRVHQHESLCDDYRREIEHEMYEKSLLPETREDLLIIIESLDFIPNAAESVINMYKYQKTPVFPEIKEEMLELVKISCETFKYTVEATRDCFGPHKKVKELNVLVDDNESLGDDLEHKMIEIIFDSDLSTGRKILQKDFVIKLGEICDLCETVLDRIFVTSIKRQF